MNEKSKSPDVFSSVDGSAVRLGGEIGDRVRNTVENNLMRIDLEGDFLRPFRERTGTGGFIGLGKLADAWVRMAAASPDEKTRLAKEDLISRILELQSSDGYLGYFAPSSRIW